jgi:hypothetical protein
MADLLTVLIQCVAVILPARIERVKVVPARSDAENRPIAVADHRHEVILIRECTAHLTFPGNKTSLCYLRNCLRGLLVL